MPIQRRSDADIFRFIKELPGGNVAQYAKLLNTTAIRINGLLEEKKAGRQIVAAGMVCGPEKGRMPGWSNSKTKRGALRSRDVDQMRRDGLLPPFIQKLIAQVHPRFQDDALNFLREHLDHSANVVSFEAAITSFMEQDRHRTDLLMETESKNALLESTINRYERLIEKADEMALRLEHRAIEANTGPQADSIADANVDMGEPAQ